MALSPPLAARRSAYDHWHGRLLQADRVARDELAAMLLADVSAIVRPSRQWDSDALGEAIDRAILEYLDRPERFQPRLGYLPRFVARTAMNRMKDWQNHEFAQHRAEIRAGREWVRLWAEPSLGAHSERGANLRALLRTTCSTTERQLLLSWYARHPLGELAALLGLPDAPTGTRSAQIHRAIARVRMRLRRQACKSLAQAFGDSPTR